MNAFFALIVCGIAVCSLLDVTYAAARRQEVQDSRDSSEYETQYYSYNPVVTTTTTTTQKTTRRTYRPEDLPATSDFPPSPDTPRKCQPGTPCGWAVYTPFTRQIEYFTKNICECPDDRSCLRVDDDLAIAAYVFKCGPKQATTEQYDFHW